MISCLHCLYMLNIYFAGGGMASGNDSGLGSSRGDTLASIVHSQTGTMSTPNSNNRNVGNGLPGPQFLSQSYSSRTDQIPLSSSNNSELDRKGEFYFYI